MRRQDTRGEKSLHAADRAASAHNKGLNLRISWCSQQLTLDKSNTVHMTPFTTRTLKISEVRNLPHNKPEDEEDYGISGLDLQQLSVLQIKLYVGNEPHLILIPTD